MPLEVKPLGAKLATAMATTAMAMATPVTVTATATPAIEPGRPEGTSYTHATYGAYDKADPSVMPSLHGFGESERDERGLHVAPLGSGGYLAAVSQDGGIVHLLGFDGSDIHIALDYHGWSATYIRSSLERPEGLLLGGWSRNSPASEVWLSLVDLDGAEQWHQPIGPCDPNSFPRAAAPMVGADRLWVTVTANVGPNLGEESSVIVAVDFDGNELDTRRVTIPNEVSSILAADNDDGAVHRRPHLRRAVPRSQLARTN